MADFHGTDLSKISNLEIILVRHRAGVLESRFTHVKTTKESQSREPLKGHAVLTALESPRDIMPVCSDGERSGRSYADIRASWNRRRVGS